MYRYCFAVPRERVELSRPLGTKALKAFVSAIPPPRRPHIIPCYNKNVKYDYFVSSRWRNKPLVEEFIKKLRAEGLRVYSFIENKHAPSFVDEDPEKAIQKLESAKDWKTNELHKGLFRVDMKGLKDSRNFILLLPAGKSCHIEAGVAYGLGKKCILIGEVEKAETSYMIFSEFYPTIDDFIGSLR